VVSELDSVAAALVTIALFMIHVYMGTAMERGAFGSVIRGDVSRSWVEHHHRTWYQQLIKGSSARK
jgi:cytochrome b subunit of formate dehydrogenase